MLFIKPEDITFETQNDLIDYITKGLPPRKQDFQRVMHAYRNAGRQSVIVDADGNQIVGDSSSNESINFSSNFCTDSRKEITDEILQRIYENQCRNRNTILITAGIVGLVGVKLLLGHDNQKDKDDKKRR